MTAKVTGRVLVHEISPARMATVQLHNSAGDVIDQVQVSDEGRFTYHLSPGSWRLTVWDPFGYRASTEITVSDADQEIEVRLDEPEGGHGS